MPEWEREYARVASQQAVGQAARVITELSPYPRVYFECIACEDPLYADREQKRWVCECGSAEMTNEETVSLLLGTVSVLEEKLSDLGMQRTKPTPEKKTDEIEGIKQWVTGQLKKLS